MRLKHPSETLCHSHRLKVSPTIPEYHERECRTYRTFTELGPNNTMISVQRIVTYLPSEVLSKYQLSDFSMANLQAIGANPKVVFATDYNRCRTIDNATSMLSSLESLKTE